ncbi:HNH endonuclease [Cytobacillus praedii]|uniref:HNH endonuclease n=1 Tax=Cytobacillus praedii TaxID=1742358 RepID=UPI0007089773|nr:HNH endonuclease [Cytobacillus praedii]
MQEGILRYRNIQKEARKELRQNLRNSCPNLPLDTLMEIPELEPVKRSREFQAHDESTRSKIVFEYLFNSRTHRWLDENVIGLNPSESRGYQAMGILHHIGLKDKHKGIFKDYILGEAISVLEQQKNDFQMVIECLVRFNIKEQNDELVNLITNDIDSELFEDEVYHKDGATSYYYGKRYERNPHNRAKAIEIHGLNCVGCGFNFEKVYGERGKDFIEIHHIKPLSTIQVEVLVNPETDLVPVCSNCHRMIHRRKDEVLTIEELREMIKRNI